MLPYIFETAFPDKEKRLSSVTLWGVPVDPLNPGTDARVSIVLIKFLRARCAYISSISARRVFLPDNLQGVKRGERCQHDDLNAQMA